MPFCASSSPYYGVIIFFKIFIIFLLHIFIISKFKIGNIKANVDIIHINNANLVTSVFGDSH